MWQLVLGRDEVMADFFHFVSADRVALEPPIGTIMQLREMPINGHKHSILGSVYSPFLKRDRIFDQAKARRNSIFADATGYRSGQRSVEGRH